MTKVETTTGEDREQKVRVAVIGGGPAGSATAICLARAGLPVMVIEASDNRGWKIGEGLPPRSRPLLQKLGVWDRFIDECHLPSYGNCTAWGSPELIDHNFIFDVNGNGWHLDRQRFDEMLMREALEAGAILRYRTSVTACSRVERRYWRLELKSQGGVRSRVIADFVVDATGRKSWFARRQRAGRVNYDWLVGLVGLLVARGDSADKNSLTLVEAAKEGWWYSALVPDGKLVVAYMSDGDLASTKAARSAEGWAALLKQSPHTRERVESHGYKIVAGPRIAPANSSHLTGTTGESWLAAGDAAFACDPLSSQGIITALEMATEAARVIQARLEGTESGLRSYAHSVEDKFAVYLANRAYYYSQERRWPESVFWQRRSDPAPIQTPAGRAGKRRFRAGALSRFRHRFEQPQSSE